MLNNMHFTQSQSRLISEWLSDLEIREKKAQNLITEEIISDNFFALPKNQRERGEKFFELLCRRRYPELTAAEDRFKLAVEEFFRNAPSLKQFIKISHSEYFEEDKIRLTLDLALDNMEKILDYLKSNGEKLRKTIL
jgi:hypothetical protein